MATTKADVIAGLLSLYRGPRYLEVGVAQGKTFHAVTAARKVAVDPKFKFDMAETTASQPAASYHQVPSDDFFGRIADSGERFDVIYLDGLHTFEQTLRDFCNAIRYIAPNGVIVVDDVVPSSYFASLRDLAQFHAVRKGRKDISDAWMGDVYRLVFFIETFLQQFTYRTISDNLGQLVVWPERRPQVRERTVEATARAPYESVLLERDAFRLAPFASILEEVRAWLAAAGSGKAV